ncbi:MAG: hypothetical protein D6798_09095 [Deltaproteobacteria bacterium]|nr:MAG: hypothetical protein D6798_09095 [Deltaproteobacteria bacterium]
MVVSQDWSSLLALPPSSESGVYYCLGLVHEEVWKRTGFRLRFTQFEARPADHPESGGKHLDAIADLIAPASGSAAAPSVGVEFKRLSSNLLEDLAKLTAFHPEVLVVWRHDAHGITKLSPRTRIVEVGPAMTTDEKLLRFCSAGELGARCVARVEGEGAKVIVQKLVSAEPVGLWPKWLKPNEAREDGEVLGEVRLTFGSHRRVVGRLNQYQSPGLNLFLAPDSPMVRSLAAHGVVKKNRETVTIQLDRFDPARAELLIEALHVAATDAAQSTAR